MNRLAAAAALALGVAGCAAAGPPAQFAGYAESARYEAGTDADAAVEAALARARMRGVNTLIVLGADWCHDSRALARWSEQPEHAAMLAARFETVFVDAGHPQGGAGRNQHIPARFGLPAMVGTPLVLVVAPDGRLLNGPSAQSWRNAASRSTAAIHAELAAFPLPAAPR